MRKTLYFLPVLFFFALVLQANMVHAGIGGPLPAQDGQSALIEQAKVLAAELTPEQLSALQQQLQETIREAGGNRFDEIIGQLFLVFILILAVCLIISAFVHAGATGFYLPFIVS